MKKKDLNIIKLIITIAIFCYIGYTQVIDGSLSNPKLEIPASSYTIDNIPEYSGKDYIILNNNVPDFNDLSKSSVSFEVYSELDSLGRCNTAYASLSKDLMPTEERGSIGSVKPTGWHTIKYDIVDGKYFFGIIEC